MLYQLLVFVALCNYFLEGVESDDGAHFFLTAGKSVPRIGKRGSKSNADFEKFFLKASKSVPRIGRRNENTWEAPYESAENEVYKNNVKYPNWSEIAERYEYDPELYSSPEMFSKLKEQADDPSVYDWEKIRMRRSVPVKFRPSSNPKTI